MSEMQMWLVALASVVIVPLLVALVHARRTDDPGRAFAGLIALWSAAAAMFVVAVVLRTAWVALGCVLFEIVIWLVALGAVLISPAMWLRRETRVGAPSGTSAALGAGLLWCVLLSIYSLCVSARLIFGWLL